MNKLVNCGCGGKAQVFFPFTNNNVYMIECKKCGICTSAYETEVEAIEAWNKAMGERIATVKDFGHPCGTYGYCSNCGGYCVNEEPYCSHCGARLEWL